MRAVDALSGCLLEALEPRTLLSTLTVNTTHDFGAGSLRQAILDANAAAGADVIEFDGSLSGQTISIVYGELAITDDLMINGPGSGQLTLDAQTRSRIFSTEADTTISGLTLTRGSTGGNGGAISNGAGRSLTLRDVSILDCAAQHAGGGIAAEDGGRLVLDDVRVVACVADYWVGLGGGGIYAGPGSSVEIAGAGAEIGKGAAYAGGGVYADVGATVQAVSLTVYDNSATEGGAIFGAADSSITLSGGVLARNASQWGGAVYLRRGSSLSLGNLFVSENTAAAGGGGIVADEEAAVHASETVLRYNTSAQQGGAILARTDATVTLTGTEVTHNSASEDGGGIYAELASLTIIDSNIAENTAGGRGGGFRIVNNSGSAAEFRGTKITGNIAGQDGGGGLWGGFGGSILLIDCTITSNTSPSVGGGLYIVGSGATISDSVMTHNSAVLGAGVYSSGQLTVVRSTIATNRAQGGGGLYCADGVLQLQQSTVNGNSADWGGGLYLDARAFISGSAIVNNEARDGGGMYVANDTSIENCTIARNVVRNLGGGIYILDPVLGEIISSTIVRNHAAGLDTSNPDEAGAGIYNEHGHFRLQSTIIAQNTAGTGGPSDYVGRVLHSESAFNLIGDAASAGGLIDGHSGNIVGADPLLGAEGDYGGPTQTYPLLPGSPAINAGFNPLDLTTDQRGVRFARESGIPDIGAFEVQGLALVVDNSDDVADGDYEPGRLSLREAVELCNLNPEADAISFATSPEGATITLGGTQLAITDSVSITGPGADLLVIDAAGASRHFLIDDGITGHDIAVSIAGLHLRNGFVMHSFHLENAGSILNKEAFSLDHVKLTGNSADGDGGAVYSSEGSLAITDSTLSGNSGRLGGALLIRGPARIDRCLIHGNSASVAGAILAEGAPLLMRNSTLSGNSASDYVGAIFARPFVHPVNIVNCTITRNDGPLGGGIYFEGSGFVLHSTIVAHNTARGVASDIGLGAASGSNNLIGDILTCGGLTDGVNGNIVGADPRLADLADNGGPTLTHALLPGSPAIDAGSNNEDLPTDQRGKPRARGPAPDIGAFEANVRPTLGGVEAAAPQIIQGSTLLLRAVDADDESVLASVRYWVDLDGDGTADTLLGDSTDVGGGFAFTVPGTISRTFPLAGVTFIARAVDDEGALSPPVTLDVGVLYSLRPGDGSTPRGSSTDGDELWTCIVNEAGDVVVFACNAGHACHLGLAAGAPAATGDAIIYTDPKDGLVYVAYPSASGLILARRDAERTWGFRNLSTETGTGAPDGPSRALTQLLSTTATGRAVVLAGLDAAGRIVGFRQNGSSSGGAFGWSFIDISADLASQGMATPAFTEMISYVTPWNAWTLAGIDGAGDIQGVWIALDSFVKWRVDNLSRITGAPPISGQLTVTQTSWSAINLGGVNSEGHLVVTWWVPSFKGKWVTSDLTAISGGATLAAGRATGFVTPWGAINYAGINDAGEVAAYWWTPMNNRWRVSPLTANLPETTERPAGNLTSHVSAAGTMSLLGATEQGDVLRLWWKPDDDGRWKLADLTGTSARM